MLVCGAILDLASSKRIRCQISRNLEDIKYMQYERKLTKEQNVAQCRPHLHPGKI
jgi:hypothetical protein